MLLTLLYIIGITAEAMTGALAAGRRKMDLFGVIIIASVTAIGGGSVRDILLGHYPLGWVKHPEYIMIVAAAAVLTTWLAPLMTHLRKVFLVLDALGLVVFSIIGAQVALDSGHAMIIAAIAAVITGVFGMAIGDVLFLRIAIRQGVAKGAGFGAASHGAGTARAYQLGEQEGVVASLVMMLSGVVTVVLAPLIGQLMWAA